MPSAPAKPCRHPRCARFAVPDGFGCCEIHAPAARAAREAHQRRLDDRRGSAYSRGYDARWRRESIRFRRLFPICCGYLVPTNEWSAPAALEFHARRMAAAEAGQFLRFYLEELIGFLEEHPIYLWRPNPGSIDIRPTGRTPGLKGAAEVVDHIIPHRGDQELFWSPWNWQTVTKAAHDEKTAKFDGAFRGVHSAPRPAGIAAVRGFQGGIA